MRQGIEEILDLCLEDLKKGIPQEECLLKYKDYAGELKPLLEIALKIESLPKPEAAQDALYNALIKTGEYLPRQRIIWPRWSLYWIFSLRYLLGKAIALILIFSLISWATINASANSLPGDILYPMKLLTEKVKFSLTLNPEEKVELRLTFADKRTKELISRLTKDGVLDREILKAMLKEAELALDNISDVPKERQALFYNKINHFNLFQKETLEHIRSGIEPQDIQYIEQAIETCGHRSQQMKEMMDKDMNCPWMRGKDCRSE